MSKAFVDTTVLTDALLKTGSERSTADKALGRYSSTALPVYAIKEFQGGPLQAYRYFHNKLATTKSFVATSKALQQLSRTPKKNLLSTALEALHTSLELMSTRVDKALVLQHEPGKNTDAMMADELRLAAMQIILVAWKRRRHITTTTVEPLSCFGEPQPKVVRNQIEWDTPLCTCENECCYADQLRARSGELQKLKAAIEAQPEKPENIRRLQTIRALLKGPKTAVTESMCRSLGDAYFALYCPPDHEILTTNIKDHQPLAAALNKSAVLP